MSIVKEHTELVSRISRELTFDEWAAAHLRARVASRAAMDAEPDFRNKLEASLRATCDVYLEVLKGKERR